MAARQIQILAGSASAVAAVMLGLAGCAAASHPTANDVPRPASQTASAGPASQAATQAGTAVRLASPLIRCADPLGAGAAPAAAGGIRGTTGQARQLATLGGNVSPAPPATPRQGTLRRVGVIHLSHPGLVMLCVPVNAHCPRGFRIVYPKEFSGHRPPVLLPYRVVCITRFPLRSLPPEPRLTPMPARTMPLRTLPPHTMPPQAAG
jgi:hypothetical protein